MKKSNYNPDHFEGLYQVERRHFWFCARNEIIETVMRSYGLDSSDRKRILEVGCGTGNVLDHLIGRLPQHQWMGGELYREGLYFAKRRVQDGLLQMDAYQSPFNGSLDAICFFDVIEHLTDDVGILRGARQSLRPGGLVFVTVPAHQWMWSYFDERSGHVRRYERERLASVMTEAGFTVVKNSYFMQFLVPFIWCGRRLNALLKRRQAADNPVDLKIVPGLNAVLYRLCRLDRFRIAKTDLRHGASLIAVGRRDS